MSEPAAPALSAESAISTMKDVARRAGVSTATVSRALSGPPEAVRPATRDRVLEAVAALGYQQNHLPQNLRRRSSKTLGLVITDITNPFFTAIVRGCEDVAQSKGYSFVLANTDEDATKQEQTLRQMASERVAGVLLATADEAIEPIRRLLDSRIPVVALDRRMQGVVVDTVGVDNATGTYEAIAHLTSIGHSRIAFIGGPSTVSSVRERESGYRRALRDVGIDDAIVRSGNLREQPAFDATLELFREATPPTAIFSANGVMTIGVLRALAQLGVRIGDDVSLIGFDDLPTAELLTPALSVVVQPTYELGFRAAELLLERIARPDAPVQEVVLAPKLVLRASTAPPPAPA